MDYSRCGGWVRAHEPLVAYAIEQDGQREHKARRLLLSSRSVYRYQPRKKEPDGLIADRLQLLAERKARWGL